MAQDLAERYDGSIEAPEQDEVIQRAKELDQQCAALGAQVCLILWLPGTAPLADMSRVLQEVGFLPYGRQLAWMSDTGTPRFTALFDCVSAQDVQSAGVDRIDLLLDLPNSPADAQTFSRLDSVGRDLAKRL